MSSVSVSRSAHNALRKDLTQALQQRAGLNQQDAKATASRMMSVFDIPAGGDGSETGLPITAVYGTWGRFPHSPVPVMCWSQENMTSDWRAEMGKLLTMTITPQQQALLGFEIVRAKRGDRHELEASGYACPPPQPGDDDEPKMSTPAYVLGRLSQWLKEASDDAHTLGRFIADNPSKFNGDDDDGEGWKKGGDL
jgi:hypothetical protein